MIALLQIDPIGFAQALNFQSLAVKDFLLGFFMALALRRGRVETIISNVVPTADSGDE